MSKTLKKTLSIILTIIMIVTTLPFAFAAGVVASGDCGAQGNNVTWTLDSDGLLTISGEGEMWYDGQPWVDMRDNIREVIIEEGVTLVSRSAFAVCKNLKKITIPASAEFVDLSMALSSVSLDSITISAANPYYTADEYGVIYSKDRSTIYLAAVDLSGVDYVIPETVSWIEESAFSHVLSIRSLEINSDFTMSGRYAFYSTLIFELTYGPLCSRIGGIDFSEARIKTVLIPDNIRTVEENVFRDVLYLENAYCTNSRVMIKSGNENLINVLHKNCNSIEIHTSNCTNSGLDEWICNDCLVNYKRVIPARHNIVISEYAAPTCIKAGLTEGQYCTRCDDITVAPIVIPALGHHIVVDEYVAPTCTETGLTEGQHCRRCDDMTVAQKVIPETNHKDTIVQVEAKANTCTTVGWDDYEYCTECDYTTYVEIPAFGHDIVIGDDIKTPVTCSTCDSTIYESDGRWAEDIYEAVFEGMVAKFKGYGESATDKIVAYYVVKPSAGENFKLSFDWAINQGYIDYGSFKLHLYHNDNEVITRDFTQSANPYDSVLSEKYVYTADGEYQVFKFVFEKTGRGRWYDEGRRAFLSNIKNEIATEANITLDTSVLRGKQQSNVYFGTYQQSSLGNTQPTDGTEGVDWIKSDTAINKGLGAYYSKDPIKWRVLSNEDGNLFLLSDQNLDAFPYHTEWEPVTWETSTMRSWLNGLANNKGNGENAIDYTNDNFLDTAFSASEQTVIADTTVVNNGNTSWGTPGGNNTTDKLFLLSIEEAENTAYGFTDDETRKSTNTAYVYGGGKSGESGSYGVGEAGWWWLRSPGLIDEAACVDPDGGIWLSRVYYGTFAARPAFNLNLSSVLFTSAANGSAQTDFAQVKEDYTGNEWKLTLKDDNSFADASVNKTALAAGETLTVTHKALSSFTDAGYNNVTAMLTDGNGNILYYGSVGSDTSETKSSITIPARLAAGTYTLSVYGEDWNGENMTDYATGTPFTTTITVTEHILHDIVIDAAYVAPTCTETGLTEASHCTLCDNATVAQEVIPATNHKDTLVQVEAKAKTCTEAGHEAYEYCTECEYTTYKEIPSNGHTPLEAVKENEVAPECEKAGSYDLVVYCDVCDEELDRDTTTVDALTHTDADGDYLCDNGCGYEFEKPADPTPDTPDTPDEPTGDTCDRCGLVHTNIFQQLICLLMDLMNRVVDMLIGIFI